MYLFYSILLVIALVILLPRFIYDALRKGKYAANFRARLGEIPDFDSKGRKVVWLHCVSVGETQAARPLVDEFLKKNPDIAFVISTTTITGQKVAQDVFGKEAAKVFYFPLDFAWTVRRALNRVNPSLVLIMETELWPRFLRECNQRKIPVAIVNGRLSKKSMRGYRLIKPFIKHVVGNVSLATMQSETDAKRMRSLGVQREKVYVTGNIKYDAQENESEQSLTEEFRARFGFNKERHLIVAASTHAKEENLIIEALTKLPDNPRLLVAPRHPERFNEVANLIASSKFSWTRRTNEQNESDKTCDIILLDSIGELRAVYPLAEIVFVGGSLIPKGGHNVLEPAAAGVCVVTGKHTSNFAAIVKDFLAADALVQLSNVNENELAATFQKLLNDNLMRNALAKNAKDVFEKNRGATKRTIEKLESLI
jgi:3-deoxy-D-manno-octulosonic-acid transferase